MAWINSGIRRLSKEQRVARNRQVEQLKSNEKSDDTQATADRAAITLNTAKHTNVIYTSTLDHTLLEWNAAATDAGDPKVFSDIDLRKDVIIDLTMEVYSPGNSGANYAQIAVTTNNPMLFIGPKVTMTEDIQDGCLFVSTWMGTSSNNVTGGPTIAKFAHMGNKYNTGNNGTLGPIGHVTTLKVALNLAFTAEEPNTLTDINIRLIATWMKGSEVREYSS